MHFIRLIRPINLGIVALTMYGIGWYFEGIYGVDTQSNILSASYTLLVVSTVMIAAAGNIINDYFDVRADRINKPDRLIIGKHVKRRVAIVSHWGLNFIAFCIALYLSWVLETFWYLFIHVFTINLLWYYSMHLKRKFLTGNILIAALTGLVPILVGFYFHQLYNIKTPKIKPETLFPFDQYQGSNYILWLVFGLATFAFILNLAREIVKDMEDVEGDKKLHAKTLPIVLGYTKTKWITAFVLLGSVISTVLVSLFFNEINYLSMFPIFLAALLVTICFVLLAKASEKKHYRTINHLIKLSMVCGLLSPIYWKLLLMYG
jgi:4-hydroxybenzoate polyprenyltransferase